MTFDYSLAGLVTVGLMIYLVYALLRARAALKESTTMTINGWLQIRALFRGPHRPRRSARPLYGACVRGRAHLPFAGPAAGRSRCCTASAASTRGASRTGSTYTVAMLFFNAAGFLIVYGLMRLQALLPLNPAEQSAVASDLILQHGGQLHHQHQLAELRRRKHAELPDANGRPDDAELRVGSHRHRAGHRAHPRLRARIGKDDRQFLGRSHALHALRAAAAVRSSAR